jgi:hypothetical protein
MLNGLLYGCYGCDLCLRPLSMLRKLDGARLEELLNRIFGSPQDGLEVTSASGTLRKRL